MDWETMIVWLRVSPAGAYLALVLGAVFGSFINVVIYRLPRRLSLLRPPSHCPVCSRPVRPLENIPVISFLLLRGRCRGCAAPIPWRYPLVEALGAVLTLLAVRLSPSGAGALADAMAILLWVAFALALLAVVFIDLDFRIIPDGISVPGTLIGLLYALLGPPALAGALLGVLAGGGGLLLIALVYRAVTGREGLGMGDVKLMALVGAFVGWQGVLGTLLIGSLAGSVVGGALIARGKGTGQTALPFGTFLAPAAWVILFAGESLWNTYLSLFPK